jgi:hypothetical protein
LVVNEDPDGYVNGTSDDDLIDHRFEDIDGDEIDHADALLPRAQPNDDVVLAVPAPTRLTGAMTVMSLWEERQVTL